MEEALKAKVVILLPEGERLDILAVSEGLVLDIKEQAVADWAFRNNHPAGRGYGNTCVCRSDLSASADYRQRAGGDGGQAGK